MYAGVGIYRMRAEATTLTIVILIVQRLDTIECGDDTGEGIRMFSYLCALPLALRERA